MELAIYYGFLEGILLIIVVGKGLEVRRGRKSMRQTQRGDFSFDKQERETETIQKSVFYLYVLYREGDGTKAAPHKVLVLPLIFLR
jgi:hypothetical protein